MDKIINIVDGHGAHNKILKWVNSVENGAFYLRCNGYNILFVNTEGKAYFYPCSLTEYGIVTTVVGKDDTVTHGE